MRPGLRNGSSPILQLPVTINQLTRYPNLLIDQLELDVGNDRRYAGGEVHRALGGTPQGC